MLEFHTLDVFTSTRFSGNPLAVVLGADDLDTAQMQIIAREFDLSETIFVQQPKNPEHSAKIRIFHSEGELPFAGHPTIGCAILLAENANSGDFAQTLVLESAAGLVPVKVLRSSGIISAEFTAPVIPHAFHGGDLTAQNAAAALGLLASDIGFDGHAVNNLQGGPNFVFVPLASRRALAKSHVAEPAFGTFTALAQNNSVYVYCREGDGFSARMFAPAHGMPEDPATGSASAIFAAQLLAAGELNDGTSKFVLTQGEDMGRKSQIKLSVDLSGGEIASVRIKGSAVRLSQGRLLAAPV